MRQLGNAVMLTQLDLAYDVFFSLKYVFLLSLLTIGMMRNENHFQSNVAGMTHCVIICKECACICMKDRVPLCCFLCGVCR